MTSLTDRDAIRSIPAEIAHIGVLAALHADCFDPAWSAQTFGDLVAAPGAVARIAMSGSQPIGLVIGRVTMEEAEILTICVIPAGRRLGAAEQMMRDAVGDFDAAGARVAFLEVAYSNKAARALYHRLGFIAVGQRPRYYTHPDGSQETALILRLNLR
jgi:ribosomal protein S18 acetylase RimI-like enzyme